jgi:Na+-translocating ferredoxin:NAD+ oxidoreductase subunit G
MSGHAEKEYTIVEVAINLFIACLVSGLIIGAVYFLTEPIAAQKRIEMKNDTMKELFADANSFKAVEGKTDWYVAQKGGETIGYIVPGESKGFGGPILFLIAVTPEGQVKDYSITKHNETPGLGDKGGLSPFKDQLFGKDPEKLVVVKDPSNKENVNALTGATITSRAVTKGVKEALEEAIQEFKLK